MVSTALLLQWQVQGFRWQRKEHKYTYAAVIFSWGRLKGFNVFSIFKGSTFFSFFFLHFLVPLLYLLSYLYYRLCAGFFDLRIKQTHRYIQAWPYRILFSVSAAQAKDVPMNSMSKPSSEQNM